MSSSSSERHTDESVEIEEISSTTVNTIISTQDEDAMILPASGRLRMHRSAVRPFFCCGSELSLISINEQQELRPLDQPSLGTNVDTCDGCSDLLAMNDNDETNNKVIRERVHRKKNVEGFPRKMSRKSWAVKLRGKLPKRLQNVDEHGNYTGSSPGIEAGCTCTAYRQTYGGQTALYDCHGASAAEGDQASSLPASLCNGVDCEKLGKAKGGKGKSRGKFKSSHSNQVGTSASSTVKAWVDGKSNGDSHSKLKGTRQKDQNCEDMSASSLTSETNKMVASNRRSGLFAPVFSKQCLMSWRHPGGAAANQNEADAENEEDSAEDESQYSDVPSLGSRAPYVSVHSQVDYVHCLVPDLSCIANCGFYWGVMDRYEAERLLENKPEGTFLLRDSAQDEYLFSVSFRRYGRSLHARVEQCDHKFSFDSHDPGVFATRTVCSLIEHYKDPSCCMFFEPMLTLPLNRSYPFSLQHLSRSIIVSSTTYDGITDLPLPNSLQNYLRYYHYKQKVRVRNLDEATPSK